MTDPCFQLLLEQLYGVDGPQLLVADENLRDAPLNQLAAKGVQLITNRYDLYHQANEAGLPCLFNDFDFSDLPRHGFQQVLYRVSKEKPVTHHIINQAQELLVENGTLVLSGEKTDGLKTYAKKAAEYFGSSSKIEKHGNSYRSIIHLCPSTHEAQNSPLDDKDYPQLRACITLADSSPGDEMLYSKPGLFGWNKIDQGSAFLATHLEAFFKGFPQPPTTLLDLGCGYGYLSAMAHRYTNATITATDNNAAAITACSRNFALLSIQGEVVAADCAESIDQTFDGVICNPPFHQGFSTDKSLTERFVRSSYRHLKPGGKALFVVNQFVPLERCADSLFRVSPVADNGRFKLILLEKT